MVVNFRLGRLKNTAPVHKSKFRKRVEFILARVGPGVLFAVLLGAFLGAFGTPWVTLGLLWATLGSFRTPLACYGLLWDVPGAPFCGTWTSFSQFWFQNLASTQNSCVSTHVSRIS